MMPSPPTSVTAAASAPPAMPPIGARRMGCSMSNSSVILVFMRDIQRMLASSCKTISRLASHADDRRRAVRPERSCPSHAAEHVEDGLGVERLFDHGAAVEIFARLDRAHQVAGDEGHAVA